jgi:hypothetical protein
MLLTRCRTRVGLRMIIRSFRTRLGLILRKLLLQTRILRLPLPSLDSILAHRKRAPHTVQLEIQSARIANRFTLIIAPPKGGSSGPTIGTAQTKPSRSRQPLRRLHQRPIHAVHLMIKTAGVAKVVAGSIAAPKRRRNGTAVDAFATLGEGVVHLVVGADGDEVCGVITPPCGCCSHCAHYGRGWVVGARVCGCGAAS